MEGRVLGRLGIATLALCLLVLQGSVARGASTPTDTVRVLVHFQRGASDEQHRAAAAAVGGLIERELRALGVTRIAAPLERGADPAILVTALSSLPGVAFAEADARVHLQFTPNDPLWTTDPYVGLGQWGPKKILLDRALDLVPSTQPVLVAVIDTGVDATHPDLTGVVRAGAALVSATSPECATYRSTGATDDNSHGTHVAGIIAALQNNGQGISGIAANAQILPVKALDCTGSGSVSDIAEGITYAVDQGARIINISLGSSSDSPTLAAAVQYALSHNVLVVAATGNCALAPTRCFGTANLVEYPGAYPGVVGVGATNIDDSIASFSTQGPQVALSAPGVRIVSTTPHYATYQSDHGAASLNYAAFSGTSQATPMVAGLAALLMGIEPSLTAAQIADRLRTTADDLGPPGTDPAFGAGRINALRAVTATLPAYAARYDAAAVPRSATAGATFAAKVGLTNTSPFTWAASGSGAVKLAYHWLDANGNVVVWDGTRTALPLDIAPNSSLTLTANVTAPPVRGAYTLRFDLVRDGLAWFSQRGVKTGDVAVTVGSGLGASYTTAAATATFVTAAPTPLGVTVTNTGTRAWSAAGPQPMRLAYHWLRADGSVAVWDGARAPAFASDVQPGQSVTVQLPVVAPDGLGAYVLRLDLVQEGVTWFSGEGVPARDIAYTVTSGYAASYSPGAIFALLPGGRASVKVGVKNEGVVAWSAAGPNPVRLAAHIVDASGAMVRWDGARTAFRTDVAPGAADAYQVTIDAPLGAGAYQARVDLVHEGIEWFSGLGIATADIPLTVAAEYRAQLPIGPLSISRSAPTVSLAITNTTNVLWTTTGSAPVRVGVHWYDAAGAVLVWDGPRTELGHDIVPGETVTLSVAVGVPPAGAAAVTIDLVSEGVRWFGAGARRTVALTQ